MRISDWSSDVCSSDLQDIASFSRMIATMIKSGVPVVQALEIIGSGNKNPRMQKLVGSIRSDIENGSSIYDALSKHPVQFDERSEERREGKECDSSGRSGWWQAH